MNAECPSRGNRILAWAILALAFCVLLTAVVTAALALRASGLPAEQLAFSAGSLAGIDLYLADARGGDRVRLTERAGDELFPVWAPDGQTLATAGDDRAIQLWDAQSGEPRRTLAGHTEEIDAVAFVPDGQMLVSSAGLKKPTVHVWDLATGQTVRTIGVAERIFGLACSPDGTKLALAGKGTKVDLWDLREGTLIAQFEGHKRSVYCVAFSPDGHMLASAGQDRDIILWNVPSGQVIRTLSGSQDYISCLAFSPDGRTLASGGWDKTIRLWNTETGEVQAEGDFGTTLRSLAFSPKGKTLAAAGDVPALSLWDAATGERIQTSSKHIDRIFAVAFRPDGQTLATGSWDKSVILWDFSESMPAPPPTSQPVAGK